MIGGGVRTILLVLVVVVWAIIKFVLGPGG